MSPREPFKIDRVGRYELAEAIGLGGFGVVYRGVDPYIGRSLAVKVSSLDDVSGDRSHRQSFLRKLFVEAEAAGQLLHPNIVTIYDVGIQEPYYYIAMEFVEGSNLKHYCRPERRLPVADVVDIIIKVCHGLDYAHQRGIIHRDIKSTNIMLSSKGEVKVADFGLAYISDVKESQTRYAGTPSYMSPEQVRREQTTGRSDIFSLGIVLYELLAGQKPFFGRGVEEVRRAILDTPHQPLDRINTELPPSLIASVGRALEKDPTRRFQDAMEFARDLGEVLKGGEIPAGKEEAEKIRMLRSLLFFSDFDDEEIYRILQIGTWMSFEPGEVIVEQQERDVGFFVIASGTAAALKEGRALGRMGRGQCFGEISFLLGEARSATVTAVTDCQMLKLNPKKIGILPLETQAKLYKVFARTLANRLLAADQRVTESS